MYSISFGFAGKEEVSFNLPKSCVWVNSLEFKIANSDNFPLVKRGLIQFIKSCEFVPYENLAGTEEKAKIANTELKDLIIGMEDTTTLLELSLVINASLYFRLLT